MVTRRKGVDTYAQPARVPIRCSQGEKHTCLFPDKTGKNGKISRLLALVETPRAHPEAAEATASLACRRIDSIGFFHRARWPS